VSFILGGSDSQLGFGIAVDSSGNAYVVGSTSTTDFPTMNPLQTAYGGGSDDAFVAKIGPVIAYQSTGSAAHQCGRQRHF